MIKGLERTFALSEKGARDLVKGFIACAVQGSGKGLHCLCRA